VHRRNRPNGGVPDWFYWTLALIVLLIGALAFMFSDWIF